MSAIKAKKGATINKAGTTCSITELKLVVGSLLEDSNAVGVAYNDISAIFQEGSIY